MQCSSAKVIPYYALITLVCYRTLQVNRFDPKSDLNSCFKMKLPLYDFEYMLFIIVHAHRVVAYYVNRVHIIEGSCSFLNKLNMAFHANSFAHLLCDFPRHLNRVSSHLKRIGEEKTRYRKPLFWFQLIVIKITDFNAICADYVMCVHILGMTEL